MSVLNTKRAIADLKELRSLTGDESGAHRVAFTETWLKALSFFSTKLDEVGIPHRQDVAGNTWATIEGERPEALLIGGHLDSVPNGGWLDGCWNVIAGLEVMRYFKAKGKPPVTIKLVNWADEEGARFGRSLFGSSAFSGHLDIEEVRNLKDSEGVLLVDALTKVGIKLEDAPKAKLEQKNCAAYLELHIEQGPVLEDLDYPLGVVLGTVGVERNVISFHGQRAHSGSTPMNRRRDAFKATGMMAQEIYTIADRHSGVCTIGSCITKPGIVTSVVEDCIITLDQRHLDPKKLAAMWADAQEAAKKFATECKVEVSFGGLWRIEPILFNKELVDMCDEAIKETAGKSWRLPSGPLHDAAEVCRAGIPTEMVFVQSLKGISHNKIEDTKEEHLEMSLVALHKLAEKTIPWIVRRLSK
jgi:N-carbamoyl-L-amino-acid hydrolase